MSTIENILASLQKASADKKTQLNNSFQEKSVWLRNEFDVIRKLIKQNPRDNLTQSQDLSSKLPMAPSSSAGIASVDGDANSRKRKSPEAPLCVEGKSEKLSPEQKRASFDIEELLQKAGLPSDLNRLKKEQLLAELETRDVVDALSLSMKSLKKELVDALKDTLLDHHRNSLKQDAAEDVGQDACNPSTHHSNNTPNNASNGEKESSPGAKAAASSAEKANAETQDTAVGAAATAAMDVNGTPGKSARKVSVMSEFRSLVHRQSQGCTAAADDENSADVVGEVTTVKPSRLSSDDPNWKQRIESEYHARQLRHRDSMARRSQAGPGSTLGSSGNLAPSVPPATASSSNNGDSGVSAFNDTQSSQLTVGSAMELNAVDLCATGDVSLPAAVPVAALSGTSSSVNSEGSTDSNKSEQKDTVPVTAAAAPSSDTGGVTSPAADSVWCEVSSVAPSSPVRNSSVRSYVKPTANNNNNNSSNTAAVSASAAEKNAPKKAGGTIIKAKDGIASKPSNVVTGGAKMTSFLDKPSNNKPTVAVPALQRAKMAKAAEEQRALLKKQQQEARLAKAKTAAAGTHGPGDRLAAATTKSSQAKQANSPKQSIASTETTTITTTTATAPTNAAAAAAAPTVTASASSVMSTPVVAAGEKKKAGIFSLFSGSKSKSNNNTNTAAAAAASKATTTTAAVAGAVGKSELATVKETTTATAAPTASAATAKSTGAPTQPAVAPAAAAGTGAAAAGAGVKLKDGVTSKSMISNIVQNYNNALKGAPSTSTTAAAGSATSAVADAELPPPPPPMAPTSPKVHHAAISSSSAAVPAKPSVKLSKAPTSVICASSGVLKDITATAAVVSTAAKVQLQQQQQVKEEATKEYVIEDRESSDEEDSGTDDENEHKKKAQSVPDWARGAKLKEALERQYGLVAGVPPMDPELIFPEVQSCNLEEIFGSKQGINRKYNARSSSAHWEPDQLTLVEKRAYRKHMGYDRHLQQHQQQHV